MLLTYDSRQQDILAGVRGYVRHDPAHHTRHPPPTRRSEFTTHITFTIFPRLRNGYKTTVLSSKKVKNDTTRCRDFPIVVTRGFPFIYARCCRNAGLPDHCEHNCGRRKHTDQNRFSTVLEVCRNLEIATMTATWGRPKMLVRERGT